MKPGSRRSIGRRWRATIPRTAARPLRPRKRSSPNGAGSVQADAVPTPPAAADSPDRGARTPSAEAQTGRPNRRVLPRPRTSESGSIESRGEVPGRRGPDRDRAGDRGIIGVKSAAFALTETPTLDLKTKNVMGIVVPKIDAKAVRKTIGQRGYGIVGTSPRIDEAAEAYENLVEDVITAAEIETTMRRLIEEIEKVKRRVNALEYRVIPELKATERFIRQRLEEMERDNFMRLKRFKAMS